MDCTSLAAGNSRPLGRGQRSRYASSPSNSPSPSNSGRNLAHLFDQASNEAVRASALSPSLSSRGIEVQGSQSRDEKVVEDIRKKLDTYRGYIRFVASLFFPLAQSGVTAEQLENSIVNLLTGPELRKAIDADTLKKEINESGFRRYSSGDLVTEHITSQILGIYGLNSSDEKFISIRKEVEELHKYKGEELEPTKERIAVQIEWIIFGREVPTPDDQRRNLLRERLTCLTKGAVPFEVRVRFADDIEKAYCTLVTDKSDEATEERKESVRKLLIKFSGGKISESLLKEELEKLYIPSLEFFSEQSKELLKQTRELGNIAEQREQVVQRLERSRDENFVLDYTIEQVAVLLAKTKNERFMALLEREILSLLPSGNTGMAAESMEPVDTVYKKILDEAKKTVSEQEGQKIYSLLENLYRSSREPTEKERVNGEILGELAVELERVYRHFDTREDTMPGDLHLSRRLKAQIRAQGRTGETLICKAQREIKEHLANYQRRRIEKKELISLVEKATDTDEFFTPYNGFFKHIVWKHIRDPKRLFEAPERGSAQEKVFRSAAILVGSVVGNYFPAGSIVQTTLGMFSASWIRVTLVDSGSSNSDEVTGEGFLRSIENGCLGAPTFGALAVMFDSTIGAFVPVAGALAKSMAVMSQAFPEVHEEFMRRHNMKEIFLMHLYQFFIKKAVGLEKTAIEFLESCAAAMTLANYQEKAEFLQLVSINDSEAISKMGMKLIAKYKPLSWRESGVEKQCNNEASLASSQALSLALSAGSLETIRTGSPLWGLVTTAVSYKAISPQTRQALHRAAMTLLSPDPTKPSARKKRVISSLLTLQTLDHRVSGALTDTGACLAANMTMRYTHIFLETTMNHCLPGMNGLTKAVSALSKSAVISQAQQFSRKKYLKLILAEKTLERGRTGASSESQETAPSQAQNNADRSSEDKKLTVLNTELTEFQVRSIIGIASTFLGSWVVQPAVEQIVENYGVPFVARPAGYLAGLMTVPAFDRLVADRYLGGPKVELE